MTTIVYIFIGALAGLMSGMLGVGGGIIVVPALAWTFHYQAIPSHHLFHLAIGTSLAIMVLTTTASAIAHLRKGHVQWHMVQQLLPGLLFGVICGAAVANFLPRTILQNCLAIFILFVALRMFLLIRNRHQHAAKPLAPLYLFFMTSLIGAASGLLGLGIGSLGIPFLVRYHTPIRHACATLVTCTIPIALCGALSFVISGRHVITLPYSSGYLYWPALINVAAASIIAAPIGATIATRLNILWLQRCFALFLFLVALLLLLG
jgi:uncharacterized membrane protein YfcA